MIKRVLFFSLWIVFVNHLSGQQENQGGYFNPTVLRYEDHVYRNNIFSPLLHNTAGIFAEPVIMLGSDQKLKLSFDDLSGEYVSFKYTFIHCTSDWKKSDNTEADYLEGFYEDFIIDYKFSLNTIEPYIHYSLIFPTEDMKIKTSGNYLLKVFEENTDEVILTMRFMVYEPRLGITALVKWSDNVDEKSTHQQVNFTINRSGYYLPRYEQDLKIILKQNGRWDNMKVNPKPSSVNGDFLVYDLPDQTCFTGDNEFRYFDIKNLKYNSDRVAQILFDEQGYHVVLRTDTVKRNNRYLTWSDNNGRYYAGAEQISDPDIESEYCRVTFMVPFAYPLVHGSVYVMGQLTRWQYLPEARMNYNYEKKRYEATMKLKQGYYNYQYVFLENNASKGDASYTEGAHFETENDYFIILYVREPGTYYDKLAGYLKVNSLNNPRN